jgi:lysozyme
MQTSDNGLSLIKKSEGFRGNAYPDPATGGKPYTVGYGTTVYPSGMPVKLGDKVTEQQADAYLRNDVKKFEAAVSNAVKVKLTQGQFDALVSFTYNVGPANMASSTLIKKLNAGDVNGAADEFPRWNKAAGKVMAGLTTRRAAERALFLS